VCLCEIGLMFMITALVVAVWVTTIIEGSHLSQSIQIAGTDG
jgi:hypothetical protein